MTKTNCPFSSCKAGDAVTFYARSKCAKCGADTSNAVTGVYLGHLDGYDAVSMDYENICPSCGNTHRTHLSPCDGWTNLVNAMEFVNAEKVTA